MTDRLLKSEWKSCQSSKDIHVLEGGASVVEINAFNSIQLQLDIMNIVNDITNVFSMHALSHSRVYGFSEEATVL